MKGFNDFSRWRHERIGIMKSVSEIIQLSKRPVPPDSLEHREPHSTQNSLRECWRSTAAAAQDSIFTEADGKCPPCGCCCSVAGKCPWQVPICSRQQIAPLLYSHQQNMCLLPPALMIKCIIKWRETEYATPTYALLVLRRKKFSSPLLAFSG